MHTDEQKAAIQELLTITRQLLEDWDAADEQCIYEFESDISAAEQKHAQTMVNLQSRIDAIERVLLAMPIVLC